MNNKKKHCNVVDKHKMRVINDFKKFKRQQGQSKPAETANKNNFGEHDDVMKCKRKNKGSLSLEEAYQKGLKVKEEKKRAALERKKDEKERKVKLIKRRQVHNKLSAKTATGQPVMKNRIQFLLNKIESNKELYCLKSKPH